MKLARICNMVCVLLVQPNTGSFVNNEDAEILQKSVKLFGPPRPKDYKNWNLPGPEIATGQQKLKEKNLLINRDSGNYTLKLRTVTKYFSYTDHYEVGETSQFDKNSISVIKGQFTEIISRSSGRYYLRTMGYISDKNGFCQFLFDVSKVTTEFRDPARRRWKG